MRGREGAEWAWCAGFVRYVLEQAAKQTGTALPFVTSFRCREIARDATAAGLFIEGGARPPGPTVHWPGTIKPGYVFLRRNGKGSWSHTGIVTGVHEDHVEVIHGNSNDEGSREGYEVCRGIMSYARLDFVCPA